MADEKRHEEKESTGEKSEHAVGQTPTGAGAFDEPGQGQHNPESSPSTEDERTGEGTGAKAGEYS
jgi:hypothetical protein